jgi:hypothetical protein
MDINSAINNLLGKRVRGKGDGLSDDIPAVITGNQGQAEVAALSDGEFVIPADVVSALGNGSSEAGARMLEEMISRIRSMKTGTKEQAQPLPTEKI